MPNAKTLPVKPSRGVAHVVHRGLLYKLRRWEASPASLCMLRIVATHALWVGGRVVCPRMCLSEAAFNPYRHRRRGDEVRTWAVALDHLVLRRLGYSAHLGWDDRNPTARSIETPTRDGWFAVAESRDGAWRWLANGRSTDQMLPVVLSRRGADADAPLLPEGVFNLPDSKELLADLLADLTDQTRHDCGGHFERFRPVETAELLHRRSPATAEGDWLSVRANLPWFCCPPPLRADAGWNGASPDVARVVARLRDLVGARMRTDAGPGRADV